MTNLTIGDLDGEMKTRLRVRAARNARTMEEEARAILREALGCGARKGDMAPEDLAAAIHSRFAPLGGLDDLELPAREKVRAPPVSD